MKCSDVGNDADNRSGQYLLIQREFQCLGALVIVIDRNMCIY